MIEETIRASGKFQVEIKSDYRLEHDRKHTAYSIETYVFVPNSFDVNSDTYPKYLFYRDTQTYIRLRIPMVLLRDIAADDSATFRLLEENLAALAGEQPETVLQDCENQVRLFCCTVKYSARNHIDLVRAAGTPSDAEHLAEYFHVNIVTILRRLRNLGRGERFPSLDQRIRNIYAYADEYCSIFVSQYAFDLLEATRRFGGNNTQGYRRQLLSLVSDEDRYRAAQGYPSSVNAATDNEAFIYRRGVLKRMMESILFLDTAVRPEGRITEQVVFSLAAGVAMMFATGIAFMSQQKYGNFTMAFFVALVVSYMFKDRIKELARLYVNKKVQGHYFDRKRHIYAGNGDGRLGYTRESFQFASEARLRPEVRDFRMRNTQTRFKNQRPDENVFLYRKYLKIFSRNFARVYRGSQVDGLTDIWRISIARFVRKMDNPKEPLFYLEGDGYRMVKASKVYHINLVIRYAASYGVRYRRFRVVLSRSGIKRIETIEDHDNE